MRLLILPFMLAASPLTAAGQALVHGRLTDAISGRAVGPAEVTLVDVAGGAHRRTVSTDSGEFRFERVAAGPYRVQVQLAGFAPTLSDLVQVGTSRTTDVSLRLTAAPIPLDSLQADALIRTSLTLENFRIRAQRATGGTFITREDIVKRTPSRLTDLFDAIALPTRSLRNLMARRPPCQPQVFVDGMTSRRWPDEDVRDFLNHIHPNDVEGIEIYRNASGLPAELATPQAQECGVIAVWTRRGR